MKHLTDAELKAAQTRQSEWIERKLANVNCWLTAAEVERMEELDDEAERRGMERAH